jgi:hypothetical protein
MRQLIRRLKNARAAAFVTAAEKVLSGERVEEELARLKDYESLIELSQKSNWPTTIAAIVVGAVCLALAGSAWTLHVPNTKVRLTIEKSDVVSFRLASPWQWTGSWRLKDAPIRLDELSELSLPPEFSQQSEIRGRSWLDIDKGKITFSAVDLGAGGSVSIWQSASSVTNLVSLDAPLRGEIQVTGTPTILAGDGPSRQTAAGSVRLKAPVVVQFRDSGRAAPAIPAGIRFSPDEKIVWRNISVSRLSFSRETSGTATLPQFVSGIKSGSLTLTETSETIPLREQESLRLDSAEGIIQELEIGADSLRIVFEGKVRKISKGSVGFAEDLTPSWLSYVYHQERLKFFWGAAIFLWGLLWSGRQLLLK